MDDLTAYQVPSEVMRVVYRGWSQLANISSAPSLLTYAGEVQARLLGQIVVEPEETTYASMRLGMPCWQEQGWGRNAFLPLFLQQTRALSFLQRKAKNYTGGIPTDVTDWITVPYSSPSDATFAINLLPNTVVHSPGRHGLYAEVDWEDTEKPLRLGDTVAVEAVFRVSGARALTIEALEVQRLFPHTCQM